LVLRLAHLNRVQNPIVNRLRQDLTWQFPEVAFVESKRAKNSGQVPLLWGWLAGERSSNRYDNLYAKSVGLGLTDSVRHHAQRLCSIEREEFAIETELHELLSDSRFEVYRQVFQKFGFGSRLQAILLSQIYPLENYLDAEGLPEVQIRKGRRSGKPTKRHLSLRRFQKALGCAPTEQSSGDSHRKKVVGGSDLCRKALWQWVFTRIEVRRSRPKNEIALQLGAYLDAEKAAGKPVALVRSRVAAKAVRLLFRELVTAISG
jgi:hypothetical protein